MDSDDDSDESTLVTIADPTEEAKPEDYILAISVTEHLRQIFVLTLIVCNFLSVNFALVFFMLSWYVQNSLEKQITFLQDFYQPQAIPVVMALSGCVMFFSSLIGIKSAIGGRSVDEAESAKSAAWYFMIYCGAAAATVFIVCFAGFMCFLEIRTLEAALGLGLKDGMEKYRTEIAVKEEIDALQEDYKCCGVDSYKDWYDVAWTEVKYVDVQDSTVKKFLKKGMYFGKDVPYSCCKWNIFRPCVDARIEDNSYHSKYNFPTDLTVYTTGCRKAITDFLGYKIFRGVGAYVFTCFSIWAVMLVIARYLHTSITQVSLGEKPIGFLIPYAKPQKKEGESGKVKLKESDEESDEE